MRTKIIATLAILLIIMEGGVVYWSFIYKPSPIQGPIGYWKFDENTGTTASDSSGNANNGIITSADWAAGVEGSALNFSGQSSYIRVANAQDLNPTNALTVEAWIKPAATSGSYGIVAKVGDGSALTGYYFALNDNRLEFDAGNGGSLMTVASNALPWPTTTWYHVAVTFDDGKVAFYRNGGNISTSISVSQISANPADFFIGSINASAGSFNGAIDEVKVYNRALSTSEVQSDYGAFRKAVQFDGYAAYAEVPSSADFSLPTTGSLTISFWLRPDTLNFNFTEGASGAGYVDFLGKGAIGQYEWLFRIYNKNATRPNRISFYVYNLTGGRGAGCYFQDDLTVGQWINLVGEIDSHYVYIYKNGVLRDKYDYTGLSIHPQSGSAPVRVGTVAKESYFKGALDDVTIYNRLLTSTEIANTYHGITQSSGVVAEWPANEGSGPNLVDISGHNHDGKLYGNVTWTSGYEGQQTSQGGVLQQSPFALPRFFKPQASEVVDRWVKASIL